MCGNQELPIRIVNKLITSPGRSVEVQAPALLRGGEVKKIRTICRYER